MANTAEKAPGADGTAPDAAVPDVAAEAIEGTAPIGTPEPPSRWRVVHGGVSGIGRNRKGDTVDQDFYKGAIVTDKQLDGNAALYFSMGAIEPAE